MVCFIQSCYITNHDNNFIFKYNQSNGIASLDPAFSKDQATTWICNNIYDGLVRLDQNLNIQPAIADSWAIDKTGLIYTFYLRNNVYFHKNSCFKTKDSTRLVTSMDFKYSFNRLLNPTIASPGSWIFYERLDSIQPFVAVDSFTFQVKLQKPFIPFMQILTMQYCSVLPFEAIDYYKNDFRKNPVGSGPFVFKRWEEGVGLFLSRNSNYFQKDKNNRQLPYLKGVKVSFIDNKKTEFLSFLQGEIDMISGLDVSYTNELLDKNGELKLDKSPKIKLLKAPYLNTEYLGFMMDDQFLKSNSSIRYKKVRQAINYGINRKELIQFLKNNIGIPANSGFVPKGLTSFNDSLVRGYSYQPELARKLIQESGQKMDRNHPIQLHINGANQDLAEFVAKQLEQVGIFVDIQLHPSEFLGQFVKDGNAEFFRRSWVADYSDPESYLTCFYSKNSSPPNYTRFSNAEYDILYEKALKEQNKDIRVDLYQKMDRIIIEEAPIVPLFYDQIVRFTSKKVVGLEPNSMNMLDLRTVNFK